MCLGDGLHGFAAAQQLVATCYVVAETQRPRDASGSRQRQGQQSPLVSPGTVEESLRTSERDGKSSTHPGRPLRGNCCILRNFKRLLVSDCPDNELLPYPHLMSGGKRFTRRDAASAVRPLAAGVSDCSRTKAQCL